MAVAGRGDRRLRSRSSTIIKSKPKFLKPENRPSPIKHVDNRRKPAIYSSFFRFRPRRFINRGTKTLFPSRTTICPHGNFRIFKTLTLVPCVPLGTDRKVLINDIGRRDCFLFFFLLGTREQWEHFSDFIVFLKNSENSPFPESGVFLGTVPGKIRHMTSGHYRAGSIGIDYRPGNRGIWQNQSRLTSAPHAVHLAVMRPSRPALCLIR